MTAYNQDFTLTEGEYKRIEIPITDSAGNAVDLTAYTIEWYAKRVSSDTEHELSKDNGSVGGITVPSPATGVVYIVLDPEDTEEFTGVYTHECWATDGATNPELVASGRFTVQNSIRI